jgi:hypothetical protein
MIVLGGWWCVCRTWNGEEKDVRPSCRVCGGPRIPEAGLNRDQLVAVLAECTRELVVLHYAVTEIQGRCTELLEENRALRRRCGPTDEPKERP